VRGSIKSLPVFIALFFPLLLAAQEGPPPQPGAGKPPGPRREGQPPPPRNDAMFFKMQTLQAMEEKVDLLLDMKRTDAAIEELKKVIAMDIPKDSPGYEIKSHLIGRLAKTYADAGRKAEALETVKKLLAEAPSGTPAEAGAWLEAGSVYKKLGMADEALKAFDKAIDLSKKLAATGWKPPGPPGPPGGQRPGPPGGGRPGPGGGRPGEENAP
jgi:tetratricopeptide (TPR) repeat protein